MESVHIVTNILTGCGIPGQMLPYYFLTFVGSRLSRDPFFLMP